MSPATSPFTDFYRLDELLTDEEKLVRQTVRAFVEKEALPRLPRLWEEGRFPDDLIPGMGELGLYGPNLDGYGLPGLGNRAYGLMMLELERGDSGLRSFASVQGGLVMYPIHRFGSEEQKRKWLPPLATGEKVGCFGLTEPDHGSDPGGMETRARRDGDGWILHGNKMWITNATLADLAVIWARDEEGVVRGFLVEKGRDGFAASRTELKMSLRASDTGELHLDEVRVPGDALLPGAKGLGAALACLNQARYSIAWGTLGSALACFEEAVAYAGERVQFDGPIAQFQLTQKKLADILTEIVKAQALLFRLADLKDAGTITPSQISLAKRNSCEMALAAARLCRQVLGANGISLEYQTGRHLCNLEAVLTYEGTHDIHTLILGQAVTGVAAYNRARD